MLSVTNKPFFSVVMLNVVVLSVVAPCLLDISLCICIDMYVANPVRLLEFIYSLFLCSVSTRPCTQTFSGRKEREKWLGH